MGAQVMSHLDHRPGPTTTATGDRRRTTLEGNTRMNTIKITTGLAAALLVGSVAACSQVTTLLPGHHNSPTPTQPATFQVNGEQQVNDESVLDASCDTTGTGYDDITQGAQVKITDESSKLLAVSTLGPGQLDDQGVCAWKFTVDEVPAGARFYQVHIGNTNRGEVTFTPSQIREWITLTLGN